MFCVKLAYALVLRRSFSYQPWNKNINNLRQNYLDILKAWIVITMISSAQRERPKSLAVVAWSQCQCADAVLDFNGATVYIYSGSSTKNMHLRGISSCIISSLLTCSIKIANVWLMYQQFLNVLSENVLSETINFQLVFLCKVLNLNPNK